MADTDTAVGYHLGAGLNYRWSERITLHGGYRRQSTAGLTFTGSNSNSEVSSKTKLDVGFVEAGIRYRF